MTTSILTGGRQAIGCDTTLFLQNNEKICKNDECTKLNNRYNFPIGTGGIVCFNDFENNKLIDKINETRFKTRYQAMYYISDLIMKHTSISELARGRFTMR